MYRTSNSFHFVTSAGALLAACGAAMGQFTSQFEAPAYAGSAAGTVTTGQNGWYLPVTVPVSVDHKVFTTAGNAYNFPANPNGCGQFDAGRAFYDASVPTAPVLNSCRAERAVDFSAGGIWEASWDCTGHWDGTLPAVDNIGSWSMQLSTSRYFQQLMSWGNTLNAYLPGSVTDYSTTTADHFHIGFGFFTAAAPTTITFATASAAWRDLPVDHWYHVRVKWDFAAAQILEVAIQDLTTGGPVTTDNVTALNWYLNGGPNSVLPLPTDIRIFAGGGNPTGNDASAWDNISLGPVSAPVLPNCNAPTCYPNCDASTTNPCLNVLDFSCFLNKFAANDTYANCDQSTTPPVLNVLDFSCFLNKFAAGCSSC